MQTNTFISDTRPNVLSDDAFTDDSQTSGSPLLSQRITPLIASAIDKTETVVREGIDALRTSAKSTTNGAFEVLDQCSSYVAERPLRSVVTAAAFGAIVATWWCSRGGGRRR